MKMICSFAILVKRYQKIMLMMDTMTALMVLMNLMTATKKRCSFVITVKKYQKIG